MPETQVNQSQSGSDVTTTQKAAAKVSSVREEGQQTTTVTSQSGANTSTVTTAPATTVSKQVEMIGLTLSFTLKIENNLPPKKIPGTLNT